MNPKDREPQVAVQIDGRYANYFKVGHNAFEFVLDFGQIYSETKTEQFHTRIVTGPAYAKALLRTLQESIDKYEQTFGAIPKENKETQHTG